MIIGYLYADNARIGLRMEIWDLANAKSAVAERGSYG
jgi:hypothetical protein